MSQMTFVLYLNDNFYGGETAFYLPIAQEKLDELMHASIPPRTGPSGRSGGQNFEIKQVAPRAGAVLCFFHGFHPQSPLHEGCLVTQGSKYIIRTDVLYTC